MHLIFALLQDAPAESGSGQTVIRIGSAVLALALIAIIILRRKRAPKKEDDEF
jgi:hypothetical protein